MLNRPRLANSIEPTILLSTQMHVLTAIDRSKRPAAD